MAGLAFDHLVIGAADLTQGVDWAAGQLGVALPPGGAHPRMGTHNHLTALGPDSFLEVIAVDPTAPPPGRPRWFALDDPAQRARLARQPALLTWVARCDDMATSLARAGAAGIDLGPAVEMTRGDLTWRISIRDDGALTDGGLLPALIQWRDGPHPAGAMTDQGLRIESLELRHPEPERLAARLRAIGGDHLAEVVPDGRASLRAVLRDAEGTRRVLA